MCNLHRCYTFFTGVSLDCTALSQSESSNFFMNTAVSCFLIFVLTIFGLSKKQKLLRSLMRTLEKVWQKSKGYVAQTLSNSRRLSRVSAPNDHHLFLLKQNAMDSITILHVFHLFYECFLSVSKTREKQGKFTSKIYSFVIDTYIGLSMLCLNSGYSLLSS